MELNLSCGRSAELKGVVFLLCLDKTKRDKIKKGYINGGKQGFVFRKWIKRTK